jgi:hypothetical protein
MSTPLSVASLTEIAEKGSHFGAEFLLREEAPSASQLKKAQKWIPGEIAEDSIVVWPVLAIDTAPTRNNVIYSEESQKKSLKRWVGITFLFNSIGTQGAWDNSPDHKLQAASQVARIFDAKLVKTPKGEVGTLLWVYSVKGVSEQTDEFINKVEAGILREVSIHVSIPPTQIVCSICKVNFFDDKNGHYPGEKFDGKMCYMETTGVFTPLELSAVACPGSVNAHFMDDDETQDYSPVPLREALGGSSQMMETIMAEVEKTPEQIAEDAVLAAQKLAEAVTPPAAPAVVPEGAQAPAVVTEAKKEDDPPADDDEESKRKKKEAAANAFKLFEGLCVACGRDGKTEANADEATIKEAAIAEFRESVESRITQIAEAAATKVADAEKRAEAALKIAGDGAGLTEMLKDYIAETVQIAITKGAKAEDARETYTSELAALSYQGVKAVREALSVATGTSQRETKRANLADTARDRASREFGTTKVAETDGRQRTVTQRRGFTAPIGPRS